MRGALRGLVHAHVGWLFLHTQRGNKRRYAPDLVRDPLIRFIDRTTLLWIALGLAVPFGLGYALGSLCHFFGRRRFDTGDESRNLAWLAPLTFEEAWHNNHHAFPTSAAHGMRWYERLLDPSAVVIAGAGAARARLGRRADQRGAPGGEARRRVARSSPPGSPRPERSTKRRRGGRFERPPQRGSAGQPQTARASGR